MYLEFTDVWNCVVRVGSNIRIDLGARVSATTLDARIGFVGDNLLYAVSVVAT